MLGKCKHDEGFYTKTKATHYLFYDESGEPDGGEVSYHKNSKGETRYCRICDKQIGRSNDNISART